VGAIRTSVVKIRIAEPSFPRLFFSLSFLYPFFPFFSLSPSFFPFLLTDIIINGRKNVERWEARTTPSSPPPPLGPLPSTSPPPPPRQVMVSNKTSLANIFTTKTRSSPPPFPPRSRCLSFFFFLLFLRRQLQSSRICKSVRQEVPDAFPPSLPPLLQNLFSPPFFGKNGKRNQVLDSFFLLFPVSFSSPLAQFELAKIKVFPLSVPLLSSLGFSPLSSDPRNRNKYGDGRQHISLPFSFILFFFSFFIGCGIDRKSALTLFSLPFFFPKLFFPFSPSSVVLNACILKKRRRRQRRPSSPFLSVLFFFLSPPPPSSHFLFLPLSFLRFC